MNKVISTKEFRTRQEFIKKENPKGKEFIIGLDAGYSSMKVFFENGYFCFPSYAKQIDEHNLLNITNENDILYKDEITGEVYMIGTTAQNMVDSTDTNDTDGELFSRKRYNAASTTPETSFWFGLFPFRSPLLRKSIFLSLPLGT